MFQEGQLENTDQERERKIDKFGLCVVHTIESIASDIKGESLKMSDREVDLRLEQLQGTEALVKKRFEMPDSIEEELREFFEVSEMKRLASKLSPKVVRLDKINIGRLITEIKKGESPVSEVLKNAEIKFVKGNISDAKKYLEDGWKVGVVSAGSISENGAIEKVHVFHLGTNNYGIMADKSDEGEEKREMTERIHTGKLDQMMGKLQKLTGGWNLILIR